MGGPRVAWLVPPSLRVYQWSWLGPDLLAGLTLAAVAIPECMGYAKIAGTPIVSGLYSTLLPLAAFALAGSSRLAGGWSGGPTRIVRPHRGTAGAPAAPSRPDDRGGG